MGYSVLLYLFGLGWTFNNGSLLGFWNTTLVAADKRQPTKKLYQLLLLLLPFLCKLYATAAKSCLLPYNDTLFVLEKPKFGIRRWLNFDEICLIIFEFLPKCRGIRNTRTRASMIYALHLTHFSLIVTVNKKCVNISKKKEKAYFIEVLVLLFLKDQICILFFCHSHSHSHSHSALWQCLSCSFGQY